MIVLIPVGSSHSDSLIAVLRRGSCLFRPGSFPQFCRRRGKPLPYKGLACRGAAKGRPYRGTPSVTRLAGDRRATPPPEGEARRRPLRGKRPAFSIPNSEFRILNFPRVLRLLKTENRWPPRAEGANPSVTAAGGGDSFPCRGGKAVPSPQNSNLKTQLFSTMSSILGALVMTSAPSGRMIITSSMRTPNLPGI